MQTERLERAPDQETIDYFSGVENVDKARNIFVAIGLAGHALIVKETFAKNHSWLRKAIVISIGTIAELAAFKMAIFTNDISDREMAEARKLGLEFDRGHFSIRRLKDAA